MSQARTQNSIKILNNLILAFLIFNLFIGVDFYQKFFFEKLRIIPDLEFMKIILIFAFFCSFTPNLFFTMIIIILFLIQIIEFVHFSYFGDFISPSAIGLITQEINEIFESGKSAFKYIYKITLLPLLFCIMIFSFLRAIKNNRVISSYAIVPVLIILSVAPIKVAKNHNFSIYYPDLTMHTMRNGIYAFSGYFVKILPRKFYPIKTQNEYRKYKIEKISTPEIINVVLVIGESVNYEHMSLYGYKRNTNVELSKLVKEGLVFKKGISSSTSTKISLPLILNSIREPNNQAMLDSKETNLFRLAKENGFQTIYLSAQESILSRNIGANYIDHMVVFENEKLLFQEKKDEALLEVLDKIRPSKKNFIVLHQRNSHSPYESNYRQEFKIFPEETKNHKEFITNTYDNSIVFNDFLLNKMINYFKNKDSSFSLFFTSDHGELLGEDGLFGHSIFHIGATKVPFLYYSDKKDEKFKKQIVENITHYEMSLLIAQKLGFKIINPNINDHETFFIHGNNHNNVYEVMDCYEITKNDDQASYHYKKLF